MPPRYFSSLNGLRFLAALVLVYLHSEQARFFLGNPNQWRNSMHPNLLDQVANFFFVLSGFVITYQLNLLKHTPSGIKIIDFYARRAWRILPLYFLAVILGLWFYPRFSILIPPDELKELNTSFGHKTFLFLFLLPNIALTEFTPVPLLSHTWAVGVLLQFYLIWPWVIKRKENTLVLCLFAWFVFSLLQVFFNSINAHAFDASTGWGIIKAQEYLAHARFNCMAIGGIFAGLLSENCGENKSSQKFVPLVSLALFILSLAMNIHLKWWGETVYPILFGAMIWGIALSSSQLGTMLQQKLNFLGQLSYPLYLFHPVCIYLSIHWLDHQHRKFTGSWVELTLIFTLALIPSLLLSSLIVLGGRGFKKCAASDLNRGPAD